MDVVIDPRFNGPPDSGHGGYSAGRAAALVEPAPGGAVEVTLRRPVPLATPLTVAADGDGAVALSSGGELVMEARPVPAPRRRTPPVVGLAAARAAVDPDRWARRPPVPHLLRLRAASATPPTRCASSPGRRRDGRFAVPWTPAAWAGDGGVVAPEFVWAALDCPSSAPASRAGPGRPRPVHGRRSAAAGADRPGAASSSPGSRRAEGRKHHTAVALHDGAGTVFAAGRATWIALRG